MGKLIPMVLAGLVGGGLAALAALGVVSTSTAAPDHNPAQVQIVDYGQK